MTALRGRPPQPAASQSAIAAVLTSSQFFVFLTAIWRMFGAFAHDGQQAGKQS
ncbi:hypothetical protein GN330_04535 [Nitratireductor sp. CAU 1489]|uniref:Uncharacterized protein n=1 Tax=Nitratireductor arenosus TaxID=2682096 RepID=A0A844QD07_9HYPH|nr:hypothetical protein [Nitratireductor arenosus]MVA96514.1 hypothetical protein [Nitratireductor arenosus]